MQISKWMIWLRYPVVLLIINMVLSIMIEPAASASGRMWAGFYAENELDTIFVGSSVTQQTFIPDTFSEKMGRKSYNMGTPLQAIPQSMCAIEEAVETHDIKTVILGMGFASLKYESYPEAELTFESARARQKGGMQGIVEMLSYMYSDDVRGTMDSINFMFPWLYNREDYSLSTIKHNVTAKWNDLIEKKQSGDVDKTGGLSKGYRNDDVSVFNYENRWIQNSSDIYGSEFDANMIEALQALMVFCNEKDIELIIINTPRPSFDIVACSEFYEQNQCSILEYCKMYDVDYYDFGLAKPEIFENKLEYFCDFEHLNRQGAEIFCQKLCEFLQRRAAGENMNQYFYSVSEFYEIHVDEFNDWKEFCENR